MDQDLYLHGLIGGDSDDTVEWKRPTDWLPVPDLAVDDDKIYILMAIQETTANFIAFYIETNGDGSYEVDWGDDSTDIFQAENAYHQYNWDDISSETLTSDGYRQVLITITPIVGVNDITAVDFTTISHPQANQDYSSLIYELKLNCPEAVSVVISEGN